MGSRPQYIFRRLNKALPIGLLAAAGFLVMGGMRVMDPLLHVIASDFGTSVPAVSVIIAAFTLPYGLCQIILGPLGDKLGKLRVIQWALACFAVTLIGCSLAPSLVTLSIARALAGAASAAVVPISLAFLADNVAYADRQVTLSRFLSGVVLAQVMAGPLGGVVGQYVGWRGVFLVQAVATSAVVVLLFTRMRGMADPRSAGATFSARNYLVLARPGLPRMILLAAFLDGLVLMGAFPFLAPFLREAFDLSYATVGMTLAAFGLGALIYTKGAARLIPWLGESRLVLTGAVIMAAAIVAAVLTPVWQAMIAVQLALGLGFYFLHAVLQARATEMLPAARGTAVASFALLLFLGQSVGALAMGALIASFDYRIAFSVDAVAIIMLGGWLSRLLRAAH